MKFILDKQWRLEITGTLDSGIDVGLEIDEGSGKFGNENKHRALNKC